MGEGRPARPAAAVCNGNSAADGTPRATVAPSPPPSSPTRATQRRLRGDAARAGGQALLMRQSPHATELLATRTRGATAPTKLHPCGAPLPWVQSANDPSWHWLPQSPKAIIEFPQRWSGRQRPPPAHPATLPPCPPSCPAPNPPRMPTPPPACLDQPLPHVMYPCLPLQPSPQQTMLAALPSRFESPGSSQLFTGATCPAASQYIRGGVGTHGAARQSSSAAGAGSGRRRVRKSRVQTSTRYAHCCRQSQQEPTFKTESTCKCGRRGTRDDSEKRR